MRCCGWWRSTIDSFFSCNVDFGPTESTWFLRDNTCSNDVDTTTMVVGCRFSFVVQFNSSAGGFFV